MPTQAYCIKKEPREYFPLQLIHTDIIDSLPPSSGGKKYIITYTEHISCYTILDFLTVKLDVPRSLKKYIEYTKNHHKLRIGYIGSDNGGEYICKILYSYVEGKGIIPKKIAAYTL
jgi:hypothetical protein